MIINHNLMANNAIRNMNINSGAASKSMQKLSTGLRINSAADDAAGLGISEKMRGQIRGLDQASANAQDGISMTQTAEGALNETTSILQRMRELANQSANGTNTTADRSSIQDEVNQLTSEINRIGNTTEFNTQKLLNGGMDSNDGAKITKATSAKISASTAIAAGTTTAKLTVDDKTFDLSGVTITSSTDAKSLVETLGAKTSGSTKLSDMVDITTDGNKLIFTAKSQGANSSISFSGADTALGISATDAKKAVGDPTTVEKTGIQATMGLDKQVLSTANGTTFNVTKANIAGTTVNSAVTFGTNAVGLNGKAFTLNGATITIAGIVAADTLAGSATKIQAIIDAKLGGANKVTIAANAGNDGFQFTSGTAGDEVTIGGAAADLTYLGLTAGSQKDAANYNLGAAASLTIDGTIITLNGNQTDAKTLAANLNNKLAAASITGAAFVVNDKGDGIDFKDKKSVTLGGTDIAKFGLTAGSTAAPASTDAAFSLSIASGSTFKVTVGSESAVTVNLNTDVDAKTYDIANADKNVAKAAMDSLVKDVNASLQNAGLSGKVSAALSKDNQLQFISESGVDVKVTDGTSTPLATLGYATTDMTNTKNVEQVVGPGVEGSGFNTTFQIGANKGQSMSLNINDMRAAALGITGNAGQAGFTATNGVTDGTTDVKQEAALDVMDKTQASKALDILDKATATVSAERGKLGAVQNRLEHTINNLGVASENLTTAESRIRDVDMAKEMSTFSKNNILSQAAQAMLAQANQQPQQVLQLLR